MCIAVKTYKCGAKEHLYANKCTEENCKDYVEYIAAPGDCFPCTTRHDKKAIDKALGKYGSINTATKAYAALLESGTAQDKLQPALINAKKKDSSLLHKAEGKAASLLGQSRELFPEFDAEFDKYVSMKMTASIKDSEKKMKDDDTQVGHMVSGATSAKDQDDNDHGRVKEAAAATAAKTPRKDQSQASLKGSPLAERKNEELTPNSLKNSRSNDQNDPPSRKSKSAKEIESDTADGDSSDDDMGGSDVENLPRP